MKHVCIRFRIFLTVVHMEELLGIILPVNDKQCPCQHH